MLSVEDGFEAIRSLNEDIKAWGDRWKTVAEEVSNELGEVRDELDEAKDTIEERDKTIEGLNRKIDSLEEEANNNYNYR